MNNSHTQPSHLTILKPCCIGDLVLTTALLEDIHQFWPDQYLSVLSSSWSIPVIQYHPAVRKITPFDHPIAPQRHAIPSLLYLVIALRQLHPDLIIVPDRSPLLSLATYLARIPERVGLDSAGRGRFYTLRIPPLPRAHELEQGRQLLHAIGIPTTSLPRLYWDHEARENADHLIQQVPSQQPYYLLAPGGGRNPGMTMAEKRWSLPSYIEVAHTLVRAGFTVALLGSAADRPLTTTIKSKVAATLDWTNCTTLTTIAALAHSAAGFIGNDSGVTHIAAASGCPTVAIFGPTAPELYAPIGNHVAILAPPSTVPRSGEGTVRNPYRYNQPWQVFVTPSQVVEALETLRSEIDHRPSSRMNAQ